jgi:hypothetical protein
MKNLLFNLLNFFHNLFGKKIKNFKKISTSPHLPLSKLNYFEKKTHSRHSYYKQTLQLLSRKEDLWVETNLNCFLNLFPWQIQLLNKLLPFFDLFGQYLYPIMINYCIVAKKKQFNN